MKVLAKDGLFHYDPKWDIYRKQKAKIRSKKDKCIIFGKKHMWYEIYHNCGNFTSVLLECPCDCYAQGENIDNYPNE